MQNEEELPVREREKKEERRKKKGESKTAVSGADNDVWQTLKLVLGVRLTVNYLIVS